MMNFSDETVEKCASKIWDCVPSMCDETWKEAKAATDFEHKECVATYYRFARAALSSLTLADLMQVPEVRGLVDDVGEYLHWRAVNPHIKGGENYQRRMTKTLASFTEAK